MNHKHRRAPCLLIWLLVLRALCGPALLSARAQNRYPIFAANVASALGMRRAFEGGFQWVRIYYPDQVNEAERYGLKVLLLLGWESALTDVQTWGNYVYDTASRYRGRIAAYQICNEPNLAEMWHKPRHADPAEYVTFLREAYRRAKQADPNCIIVSAGLAVNGGAGALAMDDVEFLRGMYAAGAEPYFDVLGSHPYGFAYAPEDASSNRVHCFRRAEQQRAVMVQYGDADKQVWATEVGWITEPGEGCRQYGDWASRWWQRVSPQVQADYLARAFRYARANWPWMGVMFVWNMDYGLVPWNDYCDQKSWFAILNHDGTPRPAYSELARMAQGQTTPTPTAGGTPLPVPTPTPTPHDLNTGTVGGRVLLQGHNSHAGAVLSIAGRYAVSGSDGQYNIQNVPAGMWSAAASYVGHLSALRSSVTVQAGGEVLLPDLTLRNGDANADCNVDLFDLVIVAGAYSPGGPVSDGRADRNADGLVNLSDVVLVSSNYGLSCPQAW